MELRVPEALQKLRLSKPQPSSPLTTAGIVYIALGFRVLGFRNGAAFSTLGSPRNLGGTNLEYKMILRAPNLGPEP